MQTLESIRRKIDSAEDLHSIVRTMKALAAVSIRQYEKAVESLVEFHRTTELGLHVVLSSGGELNIPLEPAHKGPLGAIIFGTDQGMVGQFNEQIGSFAVQTLETLVEDPSQLDVLAVGIRVVPRLEEAGLEVGEVLTLPGSVSGIARLARTLLLTIDAWRSQHGTERVFLFYNRAASGGAYRSQIVRLLPLELERLKHLETKSWPTRNIPMYTMDREQLLSALIHQHMLVIISRACAQSQASENAARLAAMQSAEKNINERMGELTTLYHGQRQNSITSELLDIVSGFEVLSGPG
jgi:F-type H+-transporting ATPase subunit gamma